MRTMLTIQMPVQAGNAAITDQSLPATMERLMTLIKPEAAYFYAADGLRSALMVFDMTASSQIPLIVEPLFMGFDASVTLTPVMNAEELAEGLAAWAQSGS